MALASLRVALMVALLALAPMAVTSAAASTSESAGCGGLVPLAKCGISEFCQMDIQFSEGPKYRCHPEYYESQDS